MSGRLESENPAGLRCSAGRSHGEASHRRRYEPYKVVHLRFRYQESHFRYGGDAEIGVVERVMGMVMMFCTEIYAKKCHELFANVDIAVTVRLTAMRSRKFVSTHRQLGEESKGFRDGPNQRV